MKDMVISYDAILTNCKQFNIFAGTVMYMLWFNFILGLNVISLCFGYGNNMIMSLRQREIKLKPRIKLNHNIYIGDPEQ